MSDDPTGTTGRAQVDAGPGGSTGDQAPEPAPVGPAFLITYPLAMIGIWMTIMTPAFVTLALAVGRIDPDNKGAGYGLVAGVGGIVALLANPLFGRLSDRTRTQWGRRVPWIVAGAAGAVLGTCLLALAQSIAALLIGWVVMQLLCNAAIAALLGVLADRVPQHQRGLVGGLVGLTFPGGVLAGTFLVQLVPGDTVFQFGAPAAIGLLLLVPFLLTYRDRSKPGPVSRFTVRDFFGSFWFSPRRNPDFAKMLAASFMMWIGLSVYQSYNVYFLQDRLGVTDSQIATFSFYSLLVSNLIAIVVAPLTGLLSDRIGRRKPPFVVAASLVAAGLVIMLLGGIVIFSVGCAVVGIGFGVFKGTYLSMTTDTLTDNTTAARDLGLLNIAITLPGTLIPVVAPAVLAAGSGGGGAYPLLFGIGAVVALLSAVPALRVRSVV